MQMETPQPEALDDYLIDASESIGSGVDAGRRNSLKAENAIASRFWGGFQLRIVLTFAFFTAAWIAVFVSGVTGAIPLWLGLVLNTLVSTTFYMPMHEAVHKNIWGRTSKLRVGEEVIGVLCSVPIGFSFAAHRASHMRHHAFTNDPSRDPDHFSEGSKFALPAKWLSVAVVNSFLPLFAFVPPLRRILHPRVQNTMLGGGGRREGLAQLRFWFITHAVLLVAFLGGFGLPALLLWYVPARLQLLWLIFIFAWYPHHPAREVGRYVDTRVAVFSGSGIIIRGHDHHALHHLYPRVPHYNLKALWSEMANDLVVKGVRAEGRAVGATRSVIW